MDALTPPIQKPWTDDEIAVIEKGLDDGLSMAQIARLLPGRTRNSVSGKIHRASLRKTPLPARSKQDPAAKKPEKRGRAIFRSIVHKPRLVDKGGRKIPPYAPRLKPEPVKGPPAPIDPALVSRNPKKMMMLGPFDCRAILGEVRGLNTLYCADPTEIGRSWCAYHAGVVFDRSKGKFNG
jgi:hypothetical protein